MGRRNILVAASLLALAGCSAYRPLYGVGPTGSGVTTALASVSVPEQHVRSAQLVRNVLLTSLAQSPNAHYGLKLVTTERTLDVSTLSASNLHRKRYNLSIHYELAEMSSGTVLSAGDSFSNVSYDTLRQPVADLQAASNAIDRASAEVGQDIKQRLAAYFADHPGA